MKRLLAVVFLVTACGGTATPQATFPVPSESFVVFLENLGQRFTPAPAPATGVVSAQAVLAKLQAEGFPPFASDPVAQAPIYGIVACFDSPNRCDSWGFARPGETLAIWLVGYPTVPGGNGGQAWAAVNAKTGEFISGDGPPGG